MAIHFNMMEKDVNHVLLLIVKNVIIKLLILRMVFQKLELLLN